MNQIDALERCKKAIATIRDAARERDYCFHSAYPIGAPVTWTVGKYVQLGEVIMHGHSFRIRVRNVRSGREIWLDGSRIIAG